MLLLLRTLFKEYDRESSQATAASDQGMARMKIEMDASKKTTGLTPLRRGTVHLPSSTSILPDLPRQYVIKHPRKCSRLDEATRSFLGLKKPYLLFRLQSLTEQSSLFPRGHEGCLSGTVTLCPFLVPACALHGYTMNPS
uniref:DNA repair protein reca n=1 Tax=Rhizophora mucronata TaxID=61149 RepID=A0A2P2K421_RHIMU